jgi:hypothetical protein
MSSEAGRLLLMPGLGKSHSSLWHVPEKVWGLCGKIGDKYPNISICFLFSTIYFLTTLCYDSRSSTVRGLYKCIGLMNGWNAERSVEGWWRSSIYTELGSAC